MRYVLVTETRLSCRRAGVAVTARSAELGGRKTDEEPWLRGPSELPSAEEAPAPGCRAERGEDETFLPPWPSAIAAAPASAAGFAAIGAAAFDLVGAAARGDGHAIQFMLLRAKLYLYCLTEEIGPSEGMIVSRMPLSYSIDPAQGIVTITGDYADAAEWRVLLTAVGRDAAYRRGFSFIRDLRSSEHPVSAQTVIGIMAVVREFWGQLGVRRAAIVTGHSIADPAVIAHALAEESHIPLRAFSSYDDAVRWVREGEDPSGGAP